MGCCFNTFGGHIVSEVGLHHICAVIGGEDFPPKGKTKQKGGLETKPQQKGPIPVLLLHKKLDLLGHVLLPETVTIKSNYTVLFLSRLPHQCVFPSLNQFKAVN